MPKLDGTHILQRLTTRLKELEEGKEVAARELRSLLTEAQQKELEDAWTHQQQLRKAKRARTEEEQRELGWKTKREVHIEVFRKAVAAAWDGIEAEFERLQKEAALRQMRIYFDTLNAALKEGKDKHVAESLANNALTRAGLRRMDMQRVRSISRRDREIEEMETQLRARLEAEMTDDEREQLELAKEWEKAAAAERKKRHR